MLDVMIDHYHTHKVRFASLSGSLGGESVEIMAPTVVFFIATGVVLAVVATMSSFEYFLNAETPNPLTVFLVAGVVFFLLSYAVDIVPRTALWVIISVALCALIATTILLPGLHVDFVALEAQYRDQYRENLADAPRQPSIWAIGISTCAYYLLMAFYSVWALRSRHDV